jgi:hypothetical protein
MMGIFWNNDSKDDKGRGRWNKKVWAKVNKVWVFYFGCGRGGGFYRQHSSIQQQQAIPRQLNKRSK